MHNRMTNLLRNQMQNDIRTSFFPVNRMKYVISEEALQASFFVAIYLKQKLDGIGKFLYLCQPQNKPYEKNLTGLIFRLVIHPVCTGSKYSLQSSKKRSFQG